MEKIKIKDKYFNKYGLYETKNNDCFLAVNEGEYVVVNETEKAVMVAIKYVRQTPTTNEKAVDHFYKNVWIGKSLIEK